MTEETITMSRREVDRLALIQQVDNRQICQRDAAQRLHLSVRQIKRLVRRYRTEGATGLVSGHRGVGRTMLFQASSANRRLSWFELSTPISPPSLLMRS